MAELLEQASQWHEMYCHGLEVMGWVEIGMCPNSDFNQNHTFSPFSNYITANLKVII